MTTSTRHAWSGRPLTRLALTATLAGTGAAGLAAAELHTETIAAWTRYVDATEQRIAAELDGVGGAFLVQDFRDDAASARRAVLGGDILVDTMRTHDAGGDGIAVPRGAIHHWRGSIFIPDITLATVMDGVQTPLTQEGLQEDVLESRVLERDGDSMRVYLKLRRKKFVTVYYGTEHVMDYARHGAEKASSRSVATRIAELVDVGSAGERKKPIGNDRGFLWRLNSYWRYYELEGGVIVECESISLSRSIPAVVRWMITPMINSAARESMARTLTSMRARLVPQAAEPLHAARD